MERTKSGYGAGDLSLPDSEKQATQEYFSELLGYSVDRLSKEPELLRADQDQLQRQIQDTAVNHYRSFIGAAQCLDGLRSDLSEAAAHLDALINDLPKLEAATEAFRKDAGDINSKRTANRQLYSTHTTLLELLEVPQLMETCIRNGNYDEALDLRAFTNKIATVHGDLPVVQQLVKDVAFVSNTMLEQLLQRLETNVQLPECLRVIGYIRRIATFSEHDLRLQYLQRREAWIAGLIAELDNSNAYEYLKRLTDIYRLNFFDVVMQYRAMFAEDPAPTSSAPAPGSSAPRDGGILFTWAQRRVATYLAAVQHHLQLVAEGGSLASVLDHAMYCGASLGRVGLDFRPLLAPLFEDAVATLFKRAVQSAVEALETSLEGHKWIAMPAIAARARQQQQQQQQQQPTGEEGSVQGATVPDTASGPPYILMEYPPLAVLANGILAALNELRHCAPVSIKEEVGATLRAALQQAATAMAHISATGTLSASEETVYHSACRAFVTSLMPYTTACFDRVYPGGASLLDAKGVGAILEEASGLHQ